LEVALECAFFWSALTCQRFGRSRPVATIARWEPLNALGVKPPRTKALTGQRTPKYLRGHGSMNSTARIMRLTCLLLLLLAVSSVEAQQPLSRDQLITAAREIISSTRYCALITLDSSGRPQARTVDPFAPDEDMKIWIGTNPRSRKVAELRRNRRVTLYYFDRDAEAYVSISGTARLVNDPKEKAKRWKKEWKEFYPDRARDYLLIAVTPEKLELVNVKKGIVGDPVTWKPPSVVFVPINKNKSRN
jgi:general stress protein 26